MEAPPYHLAQVNVAPCYAPADAAGCLSKMTKATICPESGNELK